MINLNKYLRGINFFVDNCTFKLTIYKLALSVYNLTWGIVAVFVLRCFHKITIT